MTLSGACECGAATYTVEESALHVYACHCLNCQTRSGSAFAEHAVVPGGAFDCTGASVEYERIANGMHFTEVFCETCHTRLYNRNSLLPDMIFLRAGKLEKSQHLQPIAHIWTSRKQPWLLPPEAIPSFPQSPSPEEFGAAVQAAMERGTQ
ncbi:GFA family protein [Frigidibacter sp. RF13]|uniref:GFA family protein n=1 Tax=Frigidibacter sp. RF13 TaxID=2997340 RepID=UPI00226EA68F|nr:GFA family protein [Frigidibacter sp. RF13]MCY1127047.1 GFA family protein [Frigidibacter sp. RF13]